MTVCGDTSCGWLFSGRSHLVRPSIILSLSPFPPGHFILNFKRSDFFSFVMAFLLNVEVQNVCNKAGVNILPHVDKNGSGLT